MADQPTAPVPAPGPVPDPAPSTGSAFADLVLRAIKANPVLRDQKKLVVKSVGGRVRLEGQVFTQDHYRQLLELVAKVPGGESITVMVEPEVKPPQPRTTVGRIPLVSPGPSSVNRNFSVQHVKKPRR
jgi:hypothetical protein